ncbi:hypothetical protein SLS58_003447 [Diplodia intermedia]|uniref:Uncharacterized protein n=1 Tax=Diplodia intermedia TaxID=856260 RepID=A0ABR3TWU1_9PEZI
MAPPTTKDYLKVIKLSDESPVLVEGGRLLIGSMSAPVEGEVQEAELFYTEPHNGQNVSWGLKKKSCKLMNYIGGEDVCITLRFPSWTPEDNVRGNKRLLQEAILEKASEYHRIGTAGMLENSTPP